MGAQKWEMGPENTFYVGSLAADMAEDSGQGSVLEQQEKTQGWQGIGVQTKAQAHSTAQTSVPGSGEQQDQDPWGHWERCGSHEVCTGKKEQSLPFTSVKSRIVNFS